MEHCWKLKKIAREKEQSEKKAPYSKRTFRKEVNAIVRRAGKNGNIKIVEKAITSMSRAGTEKKKPRKWPLPKKLSLATQTPPMNPLTLWNLVKGFHAEKICAAYYPI
jgi:hypothetical protein